MQVFVKGYDFFCELDQMLFAFSLYYMGASWRFWELMLVFLKDGSVEGETLHLSVSWEKSCRAPSRHNLLFFICHGIHREPLQHLWLFQLKRVFWQMEFFLHENFILLLFTGFFRCNAGWPEYLGPRPPPTWELRKEHVPPYPVIFLIHLATPGYLLPLQTSSSQHNPHKYTQDKAYRIKIRLGRTLFEYWLQVAWNNPDHCFIKGSGEDAHKGETVPRRNMKIWYHIWSLFLGLLLRVLSCSWGISGAGRRNVGHIHSRVHTTQFGLADEPYLAKLAIELGSSLLKIWPHSTWVTLPQATPE